jgi:hypothetical protein
VVPVLAVLALSCAVGASAQAQTSEEPEPGSIESLPTTPAGIATLGANGKAIAPPDAPYVVQNAVRAANRIRKKRYIWGGGHRRWKSKGYDCSGAVSYVLHAAGLLSSPLVSGQLAGWGSPGLGRWITVYANRAHTFMVIAGLRYDTSAVGESLNQGSGPRWRVTLRSGVGYAARHYPGL